MKKQLIAFCLALILMLSVVGCSASPAANQTASDSSAAEASGDAVKITFLDVMPSADRTALLEEFIGRFNAEHPDIVVEYTSVPWDEAYKKIVAMGSSGTLPDIVTCDTGIVQTCARAGYFVDLQDRFETMTDIDDWSDASMKCLDSCSYDGHVYTIPDGWFERGVFVRTDWLEEAGYNVEDLWNWTWDDFFEVCAALTDPSRGRYGNAFRGGPNGCLRFYEYMAAELEVGDAFPDGTDVSIYSDPASVELFKNYYSIYTEGWAPEDSINWGFTDMVEGFVSGQCGTLIQSPEVGITLQNSMDPDVWTCLPYPKAENVEKNYHQWGYPGSYSIASNSQHIDEAWTFIDWLSSAEINLEYSKRFGCIPLHTSSMKDPFLEEGYMKAYTSRLLDPDVEYLAQPTKLSQWGYFLSEWFMNESQKYMAGQQTAEETMEKAGQWMTEQYDKDV